MERDNLISHGASAFLKDRLFDNSDKYKIHICNVCGNMAIDDKISGTVYCKVCEESETACVPLPYATKLLFQELIAMNIIPRLLT